MILWIKLVIAAACLALAMGAVHWYNQEIRETQQALDQAKYDQALINAQADAKAQTDAWIRKTKEKDDATTKEIFNRDARYNAAVRDANKLRDKLASYSAGTSELTSATCSAGIKALSTVFGQCLDRYSAMGKHAEGHLLDFEDCRAKWPTTGE